MHSVEDKRTAKFRVSLLVTVYADRYSGVRRKWCQDARRSVHRLMSNTSWYFGGKHCYQLWHSYEGISATTSVGHRASLINLYLVPSLAYLVVSC